MSEGSLDTAYSFLGDSFFSQDEDDPTRQTSSTSPTSLPLFCIRREFLRMGRWRRTNNMEKAVWKLIACPASNGFFINHFLKQEQLDGGISLKGMVTRREDKRSRKRKPGGRSVKKAKKTELSFHGNFFVHFPCPGGDFLLIKS